MNIFGSFLKLKDFIKNLYIKNKKLFFITIFLVFAIFFILFFPVQNSKVDSSYKNENIVDSLPITYAEEIENKLKKMLLKIPSISMVDVMVVVDSSQINNYQTQKETTKTSNSSGETIIEKEEVVFEKNGSSQKPILVSVSYPKVLTVMIVTNDISTTTKISIKTSIAGVLNLEEESIFILQDR